MKVVFWFSFWAVSLQTCYSADDSLLWLILKGDTEVEGSVRQVRLCGPYEMLKTKNKNKFWSIEFQLDKEIKLKSHNVKTEEDKHDMVLNIGDNKFSGYKVEFDGYTYLLMIDSETSKSRLIIIQENGEVLFVPTANADTFNAFDVSVKVIGKPKPRCLHDSVIVVLFFEEEKSQFSEVYDFCWGDVRSGRDKHVLIMDGENMCHMESRHLTPVLQSIKTLEMKEKSVSKSVLFCLESRLQYPLSCRLYHSEDGLNYQRKELPRRPPNSPRNSPPNSPPNSPRNSPRNSNRLRKPGTDRTNSDL